MAVLDIQRRGQQIGRIRIGEQVATGKKDRNGNDRMRPSRLATFRFTTGSKLCADAIAELYGGTVRPWNTEYEVVTRESAIGVTVPPRDQVVSQWYEMWTAGGAVRRCSSQHEQISNGPCLCPHAKDPGDEDEVARCALERAGLAKLSPPKACKLVTRISVMIPDLPGLGVFRLDTHSFYAASEIGDAAMVMEQARAQNVFLPAVLRIEQRSRVANGETKKYPVPVLEITSTLRQITSGELKAGGITAQLPPAPGEQPKAITAGTTDLPGPARREDLCGPDPIAGTGADRVEPSGSRAMQPHASEGRAGEPYRCDDVSCTSHPGDDPQGTPQTPEPEPWERAAVIYQRAIAATDVRAITACAGEAKAQGLDEEPVLINREQDEWQDLHSALQDLWRSKAGAA